MIPHDTEADIIRVADRLAALTPSSGLPRVGTSLPSHDSLREIISLIKAVVFPGFFDDTSFSRSLFSHHIGVNLDSLYRKLARQIELGRKFCDNCDEEIYPAELAARFISELPEIKRRLFTDVEAVFNNDPAAGNIAEVIFSYPVIEAMIHYRVAHALLETGVKVLPRMLTEMAHSATGIDIHPGAQIDDYFAIDHGTGVVIGETAVISHHVTLYQGVTLGAKNFTLDAEGHPINIPRHPIIESHVTIYSNSSILGRVTIGHDSVIGGNVWLTHSVPPNSKVFQRKAVASSFNDGLGI